MNNSNKAITFTYLKAYVETVYDDCINGILNECNGVFKREINQLLSAFPVESQSTIMNSTLRYIFYLSVLWFDYLDRHDEYQILIGSGSGDRVPLPKGHGFLKDIMMGKGGIIDSLSNHCGHIDSHENQVLESIFSISRISEENKLSYRTDPIPDYYEKRPFLKRFGMSLMREVYDFAILCGYTQICSHEGLELKNVEQRENLHKLIHLITYDFILKATGVFESFDFWLVEIDEGRETHISYTDPNNDDYERCELSYDMHDTEEDGIINVFSSNGCYNVS